MSCAKRSVEHSSSPRGPSSARAPWTGPRVPPAAAPGCSAALSVIASWQCCSGRARSPVPSPCRAASSRARARPGKSATGVSWAARYTCSRKTSGSSMSDRRARRDRRPAAGGGSWSLTPWQDQQGAAGVGCAHRLRLDQGEAARTRSRRAAACRARTRSGGLPGTGSPLRTIAGSSHRSFLPGREPAARSRSPACSSARTLHRPRKARATVC